MHRLLDLLDLRVLVADLCFESVPVFNLWNVTLAFVDTIWNRLALCLDALDLRSDLASVFLCCLASHIADKLLELWMTRYKIFVCDLACKIDKEVTLILLLHREEISRIRDQTECVFVADLRDLLLVLCLLDWNVIPEAFCLMTREFFFCLSARLLPDFLE